MIFFTFRRIAILLLSILTADAAGIVVQGAIVEHYAPLYGTFQVPTYPETWIVLRSMHLDRHPTYFGVDSTSLRTALLPADSGTFRYCRWQDLRDRFSHTPYFRALEEAETHDAVLQDAGITRIDRVVNGCELSVDLCPSRHPLDRTLFQEVTGTFSSIECPVPITITVSGLWMEGHSADLDWLKTEEQQGALRITWVNHSFHHRVSNHLPLRENFLLEPGTDLESEILDTERLMLANGILPSAFFRFPGLVSNAGAFLRVVDLGLIPIGSDAWLAKGQWPREGSIILVHGNGNEPMGIEKFRELVKTRQSEIEGHRWLLLDLREEMGEQEAPGSTPHTLH